LILAGKEGASKHRSLIAFNMWGANLAHNTVNLITSLFFFEAPYKWGAIPANLTLPFGDVWIMFILFVIEAYLFHRVFGSYV